MTHERAPEELAPEDWAGEMGLKWLANLSLFEEMIAPIGDALLARADYRPGENVIDLGCGGGATTLAIAQLVAPSGNRLEAPVQRRNKPSSLRWPRWQLDAC